MFDLINPSKIFYWIEKFISFINSIFFILLIVALTFALLLSPPDYLQGESVRIMYVHVPAAWIGLASYTCMAVLSMINFIFKIKSFNLITKSIAPIGFMFTCLAIKNNFLFLKINPLIDKNVIEEKIPKEIQAAGTCTYIILTASLCL